MKKLIKKPSKLKTVKDMKVMDGIKQKPEKKDMFVKNNDKSKDKNKSY